jgi:predicted transcriptional regulator of viral defense system
MSISALSPRREEVLALARQRGVLRSCDLAAYGLAREHLRRLVQAGHLLQIDRGLYRLPAAEPSEHHLLTEIARRVPAGVVCLHSALAFHRLTTETPNEVWLALERGTHPPRVTRWPIHVVRFSGLAWSFGVEVHQVAGVPLQVFSPAKTVADCFKYRSTLGMKAALDALRETWHARRATLSELWEVAQVCRVTSVMGPYLEILG